METASPSPMGDFKLSKEGCYYMDMNNLRKHGQKPFSMAVIHGGPGGGGEMYPVARELSSETGVLEPLQSASSVEGQVEELKEVLEDYGNPPLMLIGFSWGAWLSYILAAHYPLLVKKLILVSSGPFEAKYAARIMETSISHLGAEDREEAIALSSALQSNELDKEGFARFGALMAQADAYDPLPEDSDVPDDGLGDGADVDIFQRVWGEASELRRTGELLQLGNRIQCPVVAIHGDYDSHSGEGVKTPLSRVIKDFRYVSLAKCGHYPWLERQAKDDFYGILKREIGFDST